MKNRPTLHDTLEAIKKAENMKRRGLLSVDEVQHKIESLIEEQYPSDMLSLYTPETTAHCLEQKRMLKRRLWRFLLMETKEKIKNV